MLTRRSGFWKTPHRAEVGGGTFRVFNNTSECVEPQLVLFRGEVSWLRMRMHSCPNRTQTVTATPIHCNFVTAASTRTLRGDEAQSCTSCRIRCRSIWSGG